jgi:hypothetical protein
MLTSQMRVPDLVGLCGQIVASKVTESNEQDPSQVPVLLEQIDGGIDRFVADGIYDQAPVYAAVEDHSSCVRVIIPPRKDAVLSPTARSAPTQRDQHLLAIEHEGRFAWKWTSGYYDQAGAENAFFRFKRTFGDRLRAKRDEAQEREASLTCQLLNRMWERGRPQSYPVSSTKWERGQFACWPIGATKPPACVDASRS